MFAHFDYILSVDDLHRRRIEIVLLQYFANGIFPTDQNDLRVSRQVGGGHNDPFDDRLWREITTHRIYRNLHLHTFFVD